MKLDVEYLGYLFGPVNKKIPYHPLLKTLWEYAPDGITISENPTTRNAGPVNDHVQRLKRKCVQNGVDEAHINHFLNSRSFWDSQTVPEDKPCLITDIPLYVGPNKWILYCEDWGHVTYPYAGNNHNCMGNFWEHPGIQCIKSMLEMDNCVGIMTHIEQTRESLWGIFGENVGRKTFYVPMGVPVTKEPDKNYDKLKILFHGSSNHTGPHFFLRGGYETLVGFNKACEQVDNIELIVVYDSSEMNVDMLRMIGTNPNITHFSRYLTNEEMISVREQCNVLCLPAFRTHSMSVCQGMMDGLVPIVSDGWGFDQFVEDGINGYMAKGCDSSWVEDGVLREQYKTGQLNEKVANNIADTIVKLATNTTLLKVRCDKARDFATSNVSIGIRNNVLFKEFNTRFENV